MIKMISQAEHQLSTAHCCAQGSASQAQGSSWPQAQPQEGPSSCHDSASHCPEPLQEASVGGKGLHLKLRHGSWWRASLVRSIGGWQWGSLLLKVGNGSWWKESAGEGNETRLSQLLRKVDACHLFLTGWARPRIASVCLTNPTHSCLCLRL